MVLPISGIKRMCLKQTRMVLSTERRLQRRYVIQYAKEAKPQRCIVMLYKLYNSRCPLNRPADAFYLKPLLKPTEDCWYQATPKGHNVLGGTVCRQCMIAGLQGHYTNHSLRTTAATRLFEAGIDEQLIMQHTGHSNTSGVRTYKRIRNTLRTH